MATVQDPNLTDAQDLTKALQDAGNAANSSGVSIDALINKLKTLPTDAVNKVMTALKNLSPEANKLTSAIGNAWEAAEDGASNVVDEIESVGKAIRQLATNDEPRLIGAAFDKLENPIDRLTVGITNALAVMKFQPVITDIDKMGSSITTTGVNLDLLTGIANKFGSAGISKVADAIAKMGEAFVPNAAEAEKFQNALIGMTASAGNLNSLFTDTGGSTLVDLTAKMRNYSNQVEDAADSSSLGVGETFKFANALKTIPGVLDQSISSGKGADNQMSALVGTLKLMSGTGVGQAEVMKSLTTAYDHLGNSTGKVSDSAQKGAVFLADVSSVANTLGLRFDDVDKALTGVAEKFRFVGDNTDSAARILGRYTDALRETGLTGKASMEIVDGMVKSVNEMTLGAKAFLSLRSGGPGGLQGAFQIEQLMRQGKLDQVFQMAEKSLRQQFGGRIYSQAEAASSPEAASQFMRQRSLLKSGAFGIGQGLENDQATRLLEALGKGNFGDAKGLLTGQDALKQSTDRGTAIQKNSENALKQLNRTVERIAIAAELSAGLQLKQLMGSGTAAGADRIGAYQTSAAGRSAVASGRQASAVDASSSIKEAALMERQIISQIMDSTGSIMDGVQEGLKNVATGGADMAKDVADIYKQNKELPDMTDRTLQTPNPTAASSSSSIVNQQPVLASNTTTAEATLAQVRARRQGVYNSAVRGTDMDQRGSPTAANVANREKTTVHHEMKPMPPTKIILQITAPPGFGVKNNTTTTNNIEVINGAAAGVTTGGR